MLIQIKGDWKMGNPLPSADEVERELRAGGRAQRIRFEASELRGWDSALLTFLIKIKEYCSRNQILLEPEGLPEGARRLLRLASVVPERKGVSKELKTESFLFLMGGKAIAFFRSATEMIAFIGEATIALSKFFVGKATFRRSDLLLLLQECGAQAPAAPGVSSTCWNAFCRARALKTCFTVGSG